MSSPRWHKLTGDLLGNKTRTGLVVLSIAVGVFAVGLMLDAHALMTRNLAHSYAAINPASAILSTTPFDKSVVAAVREMPGIRQAEARQTLSVRAKNPAGAWFTLQLFAAADGEEMQINKVRPVAGAWPPRDGEVTLERFSLDYLGVKTGEALVVQTGEGQEWPLRIGGEAHDLYEMPPIYSFVATGYVDKDTMARLAGTAQPNRLYFTVGEGARDTRQIAQVAARIRQTSFDPTGVAVLRVEVPKPGEHPLSFVAQSMAVFLGALGGLALLLSGFLVVNTVSALLSQQIRQIGIMKAIGGRKHQIATLYLALVLGYGLLAVLLAVPAAAVAARGFSTYMASILNFDMASFDVPPGVLVAQGILGLGVPLLAAAHPIHAGTKATVREAIGSPGLNGRAARRRGRPGAGRLFGDRPWRVAGAGGPLLLGLRNTFRRRGRLILTMATLTLAGAMFVSVFSVRASLRATLDGSTRYQDYDAAVDLSKPYATGQVEADALTVPGVTEAQVWNSQAALRRRPDGTTGDPLVLLALQPTTDMIAPTVVEGRWLAPTDTSAVVVNENLRRVEPDIAVGAEVVLQLEGQASAWRVVGIVTGQWGPATAFANLGYLEPSADGERSGNRLVIRTTEHGHTAVAAVVRQLQERLKEHGTLVTSSQITSEVRETIENGFGVFVIFLLTMAVLLALVGGLGLMGTLSLNVVEHTREIGVMRAIGASDGAVRRVFALESIVTGLLGWPLGLLASLPLSGYLSHQVGVSFVNAPLIFAFPWLGPGIWLGVVLGMAWLASVLPAWRASRISVREALAYE